MDPKVDQAEKKDQNLKKPVRNAVDLQKLKLDKLFKNIERPVHLPEPPKKRSFSAAPEFVRNVMGSSAGAGSGEFHVYRHIRRRENARVKFIAEEAAKEDKDMAYQRKLEENRVSSEQRTAKKRAKRQKKRARQQGKEKRPKVAAPTATEQGSDDDSNGDGDDSESEPGQEQEPESTEGERIQGLGAEAEPPDGTGVAATAAPDAVNCDTGAGSDPSDGSDAAPAPGSVPANSEAEAGSEADGRTDRAHTAAATDETEAGT